MNEKFVNILEALDQPETELDEALGRPKKAVDPDAKPKVAGKKGRPKADPEDDDKGENVRTVTLTAKINVDGKKSTDEKVLKDFKMDTLDAEIDKWEKQLHKKHNYDADISVSKKIGNYNVNPKAEHQVKDSDGADSEDDSYSLGYK
jgi:hypothetical protein